MVLQKLESDSIKYLFKAETIESLSASNTMDMVAIQYFLYDLPAACLVQKVSTGWGL